MNREDIITGLSERLRRRGVTASRADLEALACGMPRALAPADDIDVLAMLYMWGQAAEQRRKRIRAWVEAGPWVVAGATLVAAGAFFGWMCLESAYTAPVEGLRLVGAAARGVLATGVVVIAVGIVKAVRQSLAVRREIRAVFRGEPAPNDVQSSTQR